LARIVTDVRAEEPPYDTGRERVRARIVRYAQDQAERRGETCGAAWERRIGRSRPVTARLDAVWPRVRP
ncbi:AAA family ATPase, partial [Streptomyces sp. TRM76130]|nr:AAA family ATPase [Streptomyces sp. TRM76130]